MSKGRKNKKSAQLAELQRSLDLLWEGHDAETVRFKTNSAERESRKQAGKLRKAMTELVRAVHDLAIDNINIENLDPEIKNLGPEITQLHLKTARLIINKRVVMALDKVIFALLPTKRKEIEQKKSKNSDRKKGAALTNEKRVLKVTQRQQKIRDYLASNPNPETKSLTLAGHLIKTLNLQATEKTVNRDLKIILDKR
jgi:hypothetical protein